MSVFRTAKENRIIASDVKIREYEESLLWCRENIPSLINKAAEEGKNSIVLSFEDRAYKMMRFCEKQISDELKANGYDTYSSTNHFKNIPQIYIGW